MLNHEGYTIRGVQTLLAAERKQPAAPVNAAPANTAALKAVRDMLVDALERDTA